MTQRRIGRARTVIEWSLSLSLVGLLVYFADGFRCLGGDCSTEWWIWLLMFGPLPVAAVAAAWHWGR